MSFDKLRALDLVLDVQQCAVQRPRRAEPAPLHGQSPPGSLSFGVVVSIQLGRDRHFRQAGRSSNGVADRSRRDAGVAGNVRCVLAARTAPLGVEFPTQARLGSPGRAAMTRRPA